LPGFRFKFGEVFPAGDLLAEWAFNDLVFVNERLEDQTQLPAHWLYWLRLSIGHFAEAATFARDTRDIAEVAALIESLPEESRAALEDGLRVYAEQESTIEQIRNQAGFHYPVLRATRSRRVIQAVLTAQADKVGTMQAGADGKIRGSRLLFADDVASALVVRATGGDATLLADTAEQVKVLGPVHVEIASGIGSFIRFTNGALDAYFAVASERGAEVVFFP
jgi:hypothetical protein